jgi:hypothetical protein
MLDGKFIRLLSMEEYLPDCLGKALEWAIPLRGGCANDLALGLAIAKATGDPPAPPFGVASPNPR